MPTHFDTMPMGSGQTGPFLAATLAASTLLGQLTPLAASEVSR